MIVNIETKYKLRDNYILSFRSYPMWSIEIEEVLVRELDSLKFRDDFKLTLTVSKN